MATEQQKDFARFLLKELKRATHEINVYRAAALGLDPQSQISLGQMRDFFRQEKPIQQATEMEFQGFDKLIEQFGEDREPFDWQEFLKNHKSTGLPN
jgi:hypothetical protein